MSLKDNQKGFGVIEGLLLVIAITLIVGVGFYVVNANKDDTSTAGSDNSQSSKKADAKPVKAKLQYIEFEDLGFRIQKTEAMADWEFIVDPQVPNTRYVKSAAHSKQIDECRKGEPGQDYADSGPIDKTFAGFSKQDGQYSEEAFPLEKSVKQFDTFFISVGYPNGIVCSNTNYKGELGKTPPGAAKALENALKNAEKL